MTVGSSGSPDAGAVVVPVLVKSSLGKIGLLRLRNKGERERKRRSEGKRSKEREKGGGGHGREWECEATRKRMEGVRECI